MWHLNGILQLSAEWKLVKRGWNVKYWRKTRTCEQYHFCISAGGQILFEFMSIEVSLCASTVEGCIFFCWTVFDDLFILYSHRKPRIASSSSIISTWSLSLFCFACKFQRAIFSPFAIRWDLNPAASGGQQNRSLILTAQTTQPAGKNWSSVKLHGASMRNGSTSGNMKCAILWLHCWSLLT